MSLIQHIDKIEIFMTIVETGSLHAAARRLCVTQPALSQSLKTIEKSAGCSLIVRSREGVELTQYGRLYYDFSRKILGEVRALESDLSSRQLDINSSIRVGIFESIAIYAWPKAESRFRKLLAMEQGAEMVVDLVTGRTVDLMKKLATSEIDVAVVVDPVATDLQLKELLFEDSFFLYCSPTDSERSMVEEKRKTANRCSRPLFLFESARASDNKSLKGSYAAIGVHFETINRVDSFEVASEFVRAGLGFALLPERVAAKDQKNLYKVRIAGKEQKPVGTHAICAVAAHSIGMSVTFGYLCQALRS